MEEVKPTECRPKSAFTLFIKLYCNKKLKSSTKHSSNKVEAVKSWLSLSKEEKQVFIEKYEEYRKKELKHYAACLQKTEPYLKKKKLKDIHYQDKSFGSELYEHSITETVPNLNIEPVENSSRDFEGNVPQDNSIPAEVNTVDTDSNSVERSPTKNILIEPTPPSVRTAKELYCMLNTDTTTDWPSVPDIQKRRYQNTVLALKKDYINKYKAYLESLSPSDLFEHYCNKIDCDNYLPLSIQVFHPITVMLNSPS